MPFRRAARGDRKGILAGRYYLALATFAVLGALVTLACGAFCVDAAMAGADLAMRMDAIWREHEALGIPTAMTFGRFYVYGRATIVRAILKID